MHSLWRVFGYLFILICTRNPWGVCLILCMWYLKQPAVGNYVVTDDLCCISRRVAAHQAPQSIIFALL